MLQRYRILAAMSRMADFTVAELVELSGVGTATVRTIVGRERRDGRIEAVARDAGAGRGGRYIRYRLCAGELDKIAAELRRLEETGGLRREIPKPTRHQDDTVVPESLLSAEHVLLDRFTATHDPAVRRELLDLASVSIAKATEDWELVDLGLMGSAGQAHAYAALLLHDLADAELELASVPTSSPAHARLRQLARRLPQVLESVKDIGDVELAEVIENRFASSFLFASAESYERKPQVAVVTLNDSEDSVPPVVLEYANARAIHYERFVLRNAYDLGRVMNAAQPILCVLALPSDSSTWSIDETVKTFLRITPGRAGELVISKRFSKNINQTTSRMRVQYLATEGLEADNLGGVLSYVAPSLSI